MSDPHAGGVPMDLITLRDIELGFGGDALLEGLSLRVVSRERVCLVGRNGCGKTTLLKLVANELQADGGEIIRDPTIRIAGLPQSVPDGVSGSTRSVVSAGLGELGALIEDHQRLSIASGEGGSLAELEAVQQRIEAAGAWDIEQRIERTLARLALDPEAAFEDLSGGLARVATRIIELEQGRLTSWPGDYANYLRRRDERLAAETVERARFAAKLAREETWIRQGIKARRTRNEGRVRRLEEMRAVRARRRRDVGRARITVQSAEASGKRVFEARSLSFSFDDHLVIESLNTTVARGDRVGIIGPNGSGKTTLLRLLVGELQPVSGELITGARVQIAYFDQHRATLDEAATVVDSVADGAEQVVVKNGQRHVISYLQDFLFTPERARSPVSVLSGGERARLLLARLFAKPSNVLVMDEPTNDLDVETLELLEERLMDYPGSLLLVSHDRTFLDNVVTSTLVLEGQGRVGEYVGGYGDWLRQRTMAGEREQKPAGPAPDKQGKSSQPRPALSYKQKRELESLPERIEGLEKELAELQARLADPDFYRQGEAAIVVARDALARVQSELQSHYDRWAKLEALTGGN